MKKIKLLAFFVGIYIAVFFIFGVISFSVFSGWSDSESLRSFYHNISYLTPMITQYGDKSAWGFGSAKTFNGLYPIINLIYTGIIFHLVVKISKR